MTYLMIRMLNLDFVCLAVIQFFSHNLFSLYLTIYRVLGQTGKRNLTSLSRQRVGGALPSLTAVVFPEIGPVLHHTVC